MASTDNKDKTQYTADIDLLEVIQSKVTVDPEFIKDTGLSAKIIYYCQDCEKLIQSKRIGKKFRFSCPDCKGKNVAFGSEKSILNYYHIPAESSEEK